VEMPATDGKSGSSVSRWEASTAGTVVTITRARAIRNVGRDLSLIVVSAAAMGIRRHTANLCSTTGSSLRCLSDLLLCSGVLFEISNMFRVKVDRLDLCRQGDTVGLIVPTIKSQVLASHSTI
jgi:hypothetical protein